MRFYSCKCGSFEFFGSGMIPESCCSCDKCGTNCYKEPPAEHELELRYDTKTGKPSHYICKNCYEYFKLDKVTNYYE